MPRAELALFIALIASPLLGLARLDLGHGARRRGFCCFVWHRPLLFFYFKPWSRNIVFIAARACRNRANLPPANSKFRNASAAFSKSPPYRYHHGFSIRGSRSTSIYFTCTISWKPALP